MKTTCRFSKTITAAVLIAACVSSCLKQKEDTPGPPPSGGGNGNIVFDWPKIADSSQTALNTYFWSTSGKYFLISSNSSQWSYYWPSAHALDVLVDAYLRSPNTFVKQRMDDLLVGMKAQNGNTWLNYYYDDMEWMALACLRAYQATNDVAYKNITDILWADIKNGWSSDLGGGIWWRKDNSSKNTPSNMPAAILAARLYKAFNNPQDLQWAQQIYNWQKSVLYDGVSGWVYDNIDKNGLKNTSWKFTYNQGTFLGAALELYKITGNAGYKSDAIAAADFAVSSGQLTANGILKDEGGGDGGLFKGVFARYFNRLIVEGDLDAGKKTAYINFVKKNAETLWSKGTNKTYTFFGSAWDAKPGATTELTIQLSGSMLIEAMAELKRLNLVN
jgi:predicted alpha-1,6-mannanase (GH76 family)